MPIFTNTAARAHIGLNAGGTATETPQTDVTSALATCWKITRRDGTIIRLTSSDVDVVVTSSVARPEFDGTYQAAGGFDRTAIESEVGLSVPNMDVTGLLDSSLITEQDIRAGLYDQARVDIFRCNVNAPGSFQLYDFRGTIDQVSLTEQGFFVAQLRGLADVLNEGDMLELYGPECLADLGDVRCGIPILPNILDITAASVVVVGTFYRVALVAGTGSQVYNDKIFRCTVAGTLDGITSVATYDVAVGNTVTDGGGPQFVVEDAFSRTAVVTGVIDRKTFTTGTLLPVIGGTITGRDFFPTDSMNGGLVTWESGSNSGASKEIRDFTSGDPAQSVTLFLDMAFDIQIGDILRLYRGCDKRIETCRDIFNNIVNNRAFGLFTPGADALVRYPDAR